METNKTYNGLVSDCYAELHFYVGTFEGDSIHGGFVEKTTVEDDGEYNSDKIPVFVVNVALLMVNLGAEPGEILLKVYCICCVHIHLMLRWSENVCRVCQTDRISARRRLSSK